MVTTGMQFGLFVGLLIVHGFLKCVFLLANAGCSTALMSFCCTVH